MGFKGKYFLAGAAKGLTLSENERRKQAMETIQNSLELQGRDALERKGMRDKELRSMAVTAKQLANMGLEDSQIKLVLSQGVDRAAELAAELPKSAKLKGVAPGEFIKLLDVGETDQLSVEDFIQRGQIAGRTEVGAFNRVTGLPKGIFGGNYEDVEERMRSQYESTLGLGEQQPTVAGPRGTIDIMGMMGGEGEGYEFTGAQQNKFFTDYLSAASGMKGGIGANGELIWTTETPALQVTVSQHATKMAVMADELKRQGKYSDAQIRNMVINQFAAEAPEKLYNFNGQVARQIKQGGTTEGNTEGADQTELDAAIASGNAFKVANLLKQLQPDLYANMPRAELDQVVAEMVNKARSAQVGVQ